MGNDLRVFGVEVGVEELDVSFDGGATMSDKPVSQKLPVVKDYGMYVMNGDRGALALGGRRSINTYNN